MPAQLFLRCLRWYLDPGPLPSPVTILANAPLTAKRTANRGYTDAIARNGIRVKPMANQYPLRSIQQAVAHAGRSIRGGKIIVAAWNPAHRESSFRPPPDKVRQAARSKECLHERANE